MNDYNEAELFAPLGLNAGGRPLVLFADYVASALRPRMLRNFRYFVNERARDAGNERDYRHLQADLMFTY